MSAGDRETGERLAALQHVETLIFYDMPLMTRLRDASGGIWIANWTDCDNEDGWDEWLYFEMSKADCEAMKDGRIDMRTALKSSKDGISYLAREFRGGGITAFAFPTEELEDRILLPDHGVLVC